MMKKIIIIFFLFLVLSITTLAGYKLVNADSKLKEKKDIITYQETKKEYLTHYNYTLDNPNIITNPYGISPLTALIIFETPKEEETLLTIQGKDANSTYTNKFKKTKTHYIPIYGLYADYNNKITIKCGNTIKTIEIKTDPLPLNLKITKKENNTNNLYFIESDNYIYAIDNNNDVRWYIKNTYKNKITRLNNNNLLLSTSTLIDSIHPTGLVEIDLLGQIYNEYDITNGYYGNYAETETSFLVLSKNLLEINKKTGKIINEIKLDDNYQTVDFINNTIILKNISNIKTIDYQTKEQKKITNNNLEFKNEILLPLYKFDEYKIVKAIKFTNKRKTKQSQKKIVLVNYQKKDKNYKNHNIKLTKEKDRLVIKGNFKKNEKVYLILDKFMDKKVYDIKQNKNYINKKGLNGNYSIYIKINKKIYKTNNYVKF